VKYEIKRPNEFVQAPELGTLGIPRERSMPKRQHDLTGWLVRAEENSMTVILSADVVTLLLVEGTAMAMNRAWAKLAAFIRSIGEQNKPPVGRTERWSNAREADLTGH
jgi:hypothetical protein